jgi:ribonuclease HI
MELRQKPTYRTGSGDSRESVLFGLSENMSKKPKFYVVWEGIKPGIYTTWDACKAQVNGQAAAKYKAYESKEEAERAFGEHFAKHIYKKESGKVTIKSDAPRGYALVVDAAWSGSSLDMEYQAVWLHDRSPVFHRGPYKKGTNNIGEFLAIVHGLAFLQKNNLTYPIYSDSRTAISWVNKKIANTKLVPHPDNAELLEILRRAEEWLRNNNFRVPILKWETEQWGENPADFGRK